MDLAKLIRADDRRQALAAFDLASAQPLAVGTEAEVYGRDATTLLKLYANAERRANFEVLQKLYDSINPQPSGLRLPQIHQIVQFGDLVAVVETRLAGEPLKDRLPDLHGAALQRAETLYLDTVWKLREIEITTPPETYLLFDDTGISTTAAQTFETFYAHFLEQKLTHVGQFFEPLIPAFPAKAAALVARLRRAPPAPLALVHGDFFPGNLLVDHAVTRVQGVIDFGSFTLFGNYLLDVAGAFGFYKMYDPQRRAIRAKLLTQIMDRLSRDERPQFFQFLLANALLTSDLYAAEADPRPDGHFQWAAEIVAEDRYWSEALR